MRGERLNSIGHAAVICLRPSCRACRTSERRRLVRCVQRCYEQVEVVSGYDRRGLLHDHARSAFQCCENHKCGHRFADKRSRLLDLPAFDPGESSLYSLHLCHDHAPKFVPYNLTVARSCMWSQAAAIIALLWGEPVDLSELFFDEVGAVERLVRLLDLGEPRDCRPVRSSGLFHSAKRAPFRPLAIAGLPGAPGLVGRMAAATCRYAAGQGTRTYVLLAEPSDVAATSRSHPTCSAAVTRPRASVGSAGADPCDPGREGAGRTPPWSGAAASCSSTR
jgi:hypothetical protein